MHGNSIEAFHEEEAKLSKRAEAILEWIREHGGGTDREIAARMGFAHRSAVQPRISELIDKDLLEEVGTVKCAVTGKTVRVVDVPRPRGQSSLFSPAEAPVPQSDYRIMLPAEPPGCMSETRR